jgi:hypothetical protein
LTRARRHDGDQRHRHECGEHERDAESRSEAPPSRIDDSSEWGAARRSDERSRLVWRGSSGHGSPDR